MEAADNPPELLPRPSRSRGERLLTTALSLLLNALLLSLALFGTLQSFLFALELPIAMKTLAVALLPFLALSILCNSTGKWRFLSLVPFLLAAWLSAASWQTVLAGMRQLLHALSAQFSRLGYALPLPSFADAAAAVPGALESALLALFRFFCAAAGFFICRRMRTMGLILLELPLMVLMLVFSENMAVLPILCVFLSCLALYVLSMNRTTRIVESDILNAAGSSVVREAQTRQSLLPKQRLLSLLSLFALALLAAGALLLLPQEGYVRPQSVDRLRTALTQSAAMRSVLGLNDGLQEGRIEDLREVVLTGDTAIRVRASTPQRLYLRSFAGTVYTDANWEAAPASAYDALLSSLGSLHPLNLGAQLLTLNGNAGTPLTVSVKRENAHGSSVWLTNGLVSDPASFPGTKLRQDGGIQVRLFRQLWEYSFIAYPSARSVEAVPLGGQHSIREAYHLASERAVSRLNADDQAALLAAAHAYTGYVYAAYTALPADTSAAALAAIQQYGLALASDGGGNLDINATCDRVRQALSHCSFTQTPAAIPQGEDFTTCFLNSTQEGYCAHFATAATVLLRGLGIPARYAEGYLVTASDFDQEADAAGFVPIPDTHAHAWLEVYDPAKLDWIPFEMLPPGDRGVADEPDTPENEETTPPAQTPQPDAVPSPSPSPTTAPTLEASPAPADTPQSDEGNTPTNDPGALAGDVPPEGSESPANPAETPAPPDDPSGDEPEPDDGADAPSDGADPPEPDDGQRPATSPVVLVLLLLLLALLASFLGHAVPLHLRRQALNQRNADQAVLYGCDHLYLLLKKMGAPDCLATDSPNDYALRVCNALGYLTPEQLLPLLLLAEQVRFAGYRASKQDQLRMQKQLQNVFEICCQNTSKVRRFVLRYRYAL